ncbi:MAG: helix-turn-helix domain-containing protein [Candidatus Omnitrophota bacterium]
MFEDKQTYNYDFDSLLRQVGEGSLYKNILMEFEKPLIAWSLKRTWGNQVKAAKLLGLNRNTLHTKIRKLGIIPETYK